MKRILYLLIVGCSIFFSSCEDVEVGYLETDVAGYSVDTLYLYNIEARLEELKASWDLLYEAGGQYYEESLWWQEEYARRLQARYDFEDEVLYPLEDAYDANPTPELEEQLDAAYDRYDELEAARREARNNWYDADDEFIAIAESMGLDYEDLLENIGKHENIIQYKIPWMTLPIEGVLGTEPMTYSISSVYNENPENARLFQESLSIIGGGRMYVSQDVEAPVGTYVVSIAIKNEGQSVVLENVFTFIVMAKEMEEE